MPRLVQCQNRQAQMQQIMALLQQQLDASRRIATQQAAVGRAAIPLRHGLTIGELARCVNTLLHIDADLDVVQLEGWKRNDGWPAARVWVPPSPNLPTVGAARVYAGQVLLTLESMKMESGVAAPRDGVIEAVHVTSGQTVNAGDVLVTFAERDD